MILKCTRHVLEQTKGPQNSYKKTEGVRGVLPGPYFIVSMSELQPVYFAGAQMTVRNVADANQPKGAPLDSQGSSLANSRFPLHVVPCHLPTATFLL